MHTTFSDKKSRIKYLEIAKKVNVKNIVALSFEDVDIDLARHNCQYRAIIGGSSVKDVVFFTYRKKYEKPELSEGFTKILKIPFVPQFDSIPNEIIYNMYL